MRICFLRINVGSLRKSLCNKSCFISSDLIIFISFMQKYLFKSHRFYTFRCMNYRSKNSMFWKWVQLCLDDFFPLGSILSITTFFNRFRFRMLIFMNDIMCNIIHKNVVHNYISSIPSFSCHDIIYRDLIVIYLSLFNIFTISYVQDFFLNISIVD